MGKVSSPQRALAPKVLDSLALEVDELRAQLLAMEGALSSALSAVHPDNLPSARNLAHYLALRQYDIRDLQLRLARVGLSSLGRSESHVLVTLDRIIAMLALARGNPIPQIDASPVGFRHGERILRRNARDLLGPARPHRSVRIVVTLPPEAASDPQVVADFVAAGMDCARINCARDDLETWTAMAENVRAASDASGHSTRILIDLGGRKLRTGSIPGGKQYLLLKIGDAFEMVRAGKLPTTSKPLPRIRCASPETFDYTQAGQSIWFDDGKLGGIIEEAGPYGIRVRVSHAKPDGTKLRPDRGINLPDSDITLPAITEKDRADLAGVVAFADVIDLSFAQRDTDVLDLYAELDRLGADDVGVILKIETRTGFMNLPQMMLAAMRRRSCGVMIARGDLAVETGFERMAEIQEEMLWISEAAHLPTVWATQVLDNLAKEGSLSRAEVTDAAMSGRAEAVMLNKGPFITDAMRTLDDILGRMHKHQSKKRALFRALHVGRSLWSETSAG
jgi:pyruvate kinase